MNNPIPDFGAATTLMVQGTTSDAGKSVLVAGLCRVLARAGIRVVPFKPQNMALNSAVTTDGGEIGRAQAVQAQAAGVVPTTDMNPVLLKPSSDTGAQVIIQGHAVSDMQAVGFHNYKKVAMGAVLESHSRLQAISDAIIVEGAGSPAEINLREGDIANMGFAEAVDCPVVIVADIDRGGVFAHLVGTLDLLSESEQRRVTGFIINRFRGDISLLQPGLDWLEQRTGKPVLGVIPYLQGLHLEAEDAIATEQVQDTELPESEVLKVIVPVVSRISNHTDFDALRLHPQLDVAFIGPGAAIPSADLIILPGSKNTRMDRQWLLDNGWDEAIHKHLRYGGKLVGICGGFQMLGTTIHDPQGIEGPAGSSDGLGLLDFETTLAPQKQLHKVRGSITLGGRSAAVSGYEIHAGISSGQALNNAPIHLHNKKDGAISEDDQILGTYLHGIFDEPEALTAVLHWAGVGRVEQVDYYQRREADIDRLADCLATHLDLESLFAAMPWFAGTRLNMAACE